jgi:hypothetical protein
VPARLAELAQRAPAGVPGSSREERCDLCGEPLSPGHRHLVDVESRRLLCACRACVVLFDRPGAGGGHLRLVPTRRQRLDGFRLDASDWEQLRIPVQMAFFFRSSAAGRVVALYPSPMGATESLLQLDAWSLLAAANPQLGELEPDVEALLVSHARGMREHWRVPIDDCYELVGLIRSNWRGFGGGEQVWSELERFFDDLSSREEARW